LSQVRNLLADPRQACVEIVFTCRHACDSTPAWSRVQLIREEKRPSRARMKSA
jgi:hypothetical protein